jgi:hypothetical protein
MITDGGGLTKGELLLYMQNGHKWYLTTRPCKILSVLGQTLHNQNNLIISVFLGIKYNLQLFVNLMMMVYVLNL